MAEQPTAGTARAVGGDRLPVSQLRVAARAFNEEEGFFERLDNLPRAALPVPAVLLDRLVDEGGVCGLSDVS